MQFRLITLVMGRESNTIEFKHGTRWLTCVQGAPVPLEVTGAEMNERGKPEAVWPARWMAPNKTDGTNHANPPSTRARVPATPRRGRTARPSPNWDSKWNRAYEPDEYGTERLHDPVHIHRAAPKATQEPVRAQAPTAVDGTGSERQERRTRQHRTRTADNGLDGRNTAPPVPELVREPTAKTTHATAHAQALTAVLTPREVPLCYARAV